MTEQELKVKIKSLWKEFEEKIKPLEIELKNIESQEYINKYFMDYDEYTCCNLKMYKVKRLAFNDKGVNKYSCVIVNDDTIEEGIISEYTLSEECSKEEFDNYFTNTLQTILKC